DPERPALLAATDMEISVRAPLEAAVAEPGRAVLPGRLLLDIARRLPDGPVALSLPGGGIATLEAGQSSYRLRTYAGEDYPSLPEIDEERVFIVERDGFVPAVERVLPAASRDEARPVLTGVLLEFSSEQLTVAATDSYRMAVNTGAVVGGPPEDLSV